MARVVRRLAAVAAGVVVAGGTTLAGATLEVPGSARVAAPSVDLLATALIMGGTTEVLSVGPNTPQFLADYAANNYLDYIAPTGLCVGGDPGCSLTAVYTPAQMWPLTGLADMRLDVSVEAGRANLDDCLRGLSCTITRAPFTSTAVQTVTDSVLVVNGQSQSSVIGTVEKRHLIAHPVPGTTINFILVSNPNRPNGGVLERFVGAYLPLIGMDFNGATPTNSPETNPLSTVDLTRQYDGWSDFPLNPLNLLADLNAVLGATFLHASYDEIDTPPLLQGRYQDSTYFLYPTDLLPLLMPLAAVPVVGMPLAKVLDAPLRVLVETGYDRTLNPGQATPAKWLYVPNPIDTLVNFVVAIPTGWDDAIAYVSGDPLNRPFHTKPQGVYGVGGPPVDAGSVDPYGPVVPPPPPPAVLRTVADSVADSGTDSGTLVPARAEAVADVPGEAAAPAAGAARIRTTTAASSAPTPRSAAGPAATSRQARAGDDTRATAHVAGSRNVKR